MNKKIGLLTFVAMFLLSAMVVTSVATQRLPGVVAGNWFKYGTIDISWSSNHPNATFPPPGNEWLEEMNETEWMRISVEDVSGTNVTFQMIGHYKSGSEETSGGYLDVETGAAENATFMAIAANLEANDTIYASGPYSTWKINETIVRTYPDEDRETNHLNMTWGPYSWTIGETDYYYYNTMNFYWDKSTGILVEEYFEEINQTGDYTTSWSALFIVTESNVWVVPEFPTWTSILLIFVVLTVAIATYKRRLLKHRFIKQ